MRSRLFLVPILLLLAVPAFAVERWILISGTVGTFHTDARIFNPSFEKDIQIRATFLPTGNVNNSDKTPITITIPKRQMRILDDVTTALFSASGLGAIRFESDDEFEATSRIYSLQPAGTLGQFGPGMPTTSAKAKGAILQMKANGVSRQSGTFRTNIGVVNPTANPVTVSWILYDKNNAVVGPAGTTTLQPLGVVAPSGVASFFAPQTADLSDSWVSYSASAPIFVYGSVLDNGTEDQTFVPAVDDRGVPPASQPEPPALKKFNVSLRDGQISISPGLTGLKRGDQVELTIRNLGGDHSFQIAGPGGENVVPDTGLVPGNGITRTFEITANGRYFYFCTRTTCGTGHLAMSGDFLVGDEDDPYDPGGGRY